MLFGFEDCTQTGITLLDPSLLIFAIVIMDFYDYRHIMFNVTNCFLSLGLVKLVAIVSS